MLHDTNAVEFVCDFVKISLLIMKFFTEHFYINRLAVYFLEYNCQVDMLSIIFIHFKKYQLHLSKFQSSQDSVCKEGRMSVVKQGIFIM